MTEPESQKDCRICFEYCSQYSMISPCDCSGSMKDVHKECLLSWINTSHSQKCNVCGSQYRCQLMGRRPTFWTFFKKDFPNTAIDLMALIHICIVMICSQILAFYVMNCVFKQKHNSSQVLCKTLDKVLKIVITIVVITSTAINTFTLIAFWSELQQIIVERWDQLTEYSFKE